MTKPLYEELKEKAEKCRARNNAYERVMLAGTVLDNLPAILSALKNQWIPVNERLPKKYEHVLLFDGDIVFGYYTGNKKRRVWEAQGYDYDGAYGEAKGVTHWMPMPLAPDAAQSQEDRHG